MVNLVKVLSVVFTVSLSFYVSLTSASKMDDTVFLSPTYESKTGQAKIDELWQVMVDGKGKTGSLPNGWHFLQFLASDLNPTFDHYKDTSPFNGKKTIHPIGTVTMAKFDTTNVPDHQFTGLFKGSEHLLLRLSLAVSPDTESAAPGIAVKFLRNGIPSANFVAMYAIDGQAGSGNFFLNEFRNHVSPPTSFTTKLLAEKFRLTEKFAEYVGLSHLAETDALGQPIDAPVFPFQIIMVPNVVLTAKFADAEPMDDLATMMNQLTKGTKLYDLFALETPESSVRIPLGSFVMTSEMISSINSDELLFFRHQRMTEDFNLKPEWNPHQHTSHHLGNEKCPFSL